jgi:hypothetical protein
MFSFKPVTESSQLLPLELKQSALREFGHRMPLLDSRLHHLEMDTKYS